ncbi:MAG: hypothetical protein ACTSW2_06300 [Alphaproteobacteria bacterium]
MSNPLKTVKAFKNEVEAHAARTKLATVGITATVHRVSRYRAMASGGYVLKVRPADFQKAQTLFAKLDREIDMDEYVDPDDDAYTRCPECRSVNVKAAPVPGGLQVLAILGIGIPLLFIKRDWSCRKCGHTWRR